MIKTARKKTYLRGLIDYCLSESEQESLIASECIAKIGSYAAGTVAWRRSGFCRRQ